MQAQVCCLIFSVALFANFPSAFSATSVVVGNIVLGEVPPRPLENHMRLCKEH